LQIEEYRNPGLLEDEMTPEVDVFNWRMIEFFIWMMTILKS